MIRSNAKKKKRHTLLIKNFIMTIKKYKNQKANLKKQETEKYKDGKNRYLEDEEAEIKKKQEMGKLKLKKM